MMTKETSTKTVNFMTMRAGVLVLGHVFLQKNFSLFPGIDKTD